MSPRLLPPPVCFRLRRGFSPTRAALAGGAFFRGFAGQGSGCHGGGRVCVVAVPF